MIERTYYTIIASLADKLNNCKKMFMNDCKTHAVDMQKKTEKKDNNSKIMKRMTKTKSHTYSFICYTQT